MKTRPGAGELLWMGAGAVLLALLLLAAWRFRTEEGPAQRLAAKATRVDLVARMEFALARASEAEKSAVLAVTDGDSQALADQARAATAEVDQARQGLARLLEAGGVARERELLERFTGAFGELRRIDDEVLRLAVKNTNLKASALAFGPAADALAGLEAALSRVAARAAGRPDAGQVLQLALGARIAALHVQTLLAPHIAEESDARMDLLEGAIRQEERRARQALEALGALPSLRGDADVATAAASLASYLEVEKRILALSRENTNVRSLVLSLDQKRKAMLLCLDALGALKEAVLAEPIAGVTYGQPQSPR